MPVSQYGHAFVGDTFDLGVQVAELLPGHGSCAHSRGDALCYDREFEMGQSDVGGQVAEVGAGPLGVPVS